MQVFWFQDVNQFKGPQAFHLRKRNNKLDGMFLFKN